MEDKKKLVVLITCGLDDERSSVAFSIANGGIKSGLDVTIFLAASGVDWVRKGAADKVHLNPMDPTMHEMISFLRESGTTFLVCPPCAHVRGYSEEDLLEGIIITGSGAMHELIKQGAATLCF
jgi:predicted peroxiredoxin